MYNVDWIHGRVYGFSEIQWMDWTGMEWWACPTFELKFRGALLGILAGE